MARLSIWETPRGKVELPNMAVVVNPNLISVPINEIREMGFQLIMTNSYILRRRGFSGDVHNLLEHNGPVYTDSGAYQLFSRGIEDQDSIEIVRYQLEINSDVITPFDLLVMPWDSEEEAMRKAIETVERVKEAIPLVREKGKLIVAPIQGGRHPKVRRKCARELGKLRADVYAVGVVVPDLLEYNFKEVVDAIAISKEEIPLSRPCHLFGAGHPMVLPLYVALGCDLFDSAMYAIAARDGRYLTHSGSLRLDEMEEFPCNCPVCYNKSPGEVSGWSKRKREYFISKHNLYSVLLELKRIREAIRRNRLLDLVLERANAHPMLKEATLYSLKRLSVLMEELDPLEKKSGLRHIGPETSLRPEVRRARRLMRRIRSTKSRIYVDPFGPVPIEILKVYPFGQFVSPRETPRLEVDPNSFFRALMEYLYDVKIRERFEFTFSKEGRIKDVILNGERIGSIRAKDHFFVPNIRGARLILEKSEYPRNRVIIKKEAEDFVSRGKSVFCKFVLDLDSELRPMQYVPVVNEEDELIAVGKLILSPREVFDFERHVAVRVKRGVMN